MVLFPILLHTHTHTHTHTHAHTHTHTHTHTRTHTHTQRFQNKTSRFIKKYRYVIFLCHAGFKTEEHDLECRKTIQN